MPVKRGLLLPGLKENSSEIFYRVFFCLQSFYANILWQQKCVCPFKSYPLNSTFWHCLNLPFHFHIDYAWCLQPTAPLKVHVWSSRWALQRFFFTPSSPAVLQRRGAGLFLTLLRLLGQGLYHSDCSYRLDRLKIFFVCWGLRPFWSVVYAWVIFTTPCYTIKWGCLRPILLYKFKDNLCMFSYCLHFWHCLFNLWIYWSIYGRIYSCFFFNLRITELFLKNLPPVLLKSMYYRSSDWGIYLISSLNFVITTAFMYSRIYFSLFYLTIRCNRLLTLSLFHYKLQAFLFSTFKLFAWFVYYCYTICWTYLTRQQFLVSAFIGLSFVNHHQADHLTQWKYLKSPQPHCCCWREALWYPDLCVHCILFHMNTNSCPVLLCLCVFVF